VAGDDVQIPATFTVTVTAAATCNSLLTFAGPPSVGQVSINAQTLTVTNGVTNNGAILLTTGTLKIGADFATAGTLTVGTGTVNFDGTVNQNLSCTTAFYNLTIANTGGATNTVTLANPITVANTLTLTSGVLDVSASNYKIICQGTFTNNDATVGAFNGEAGTVDFTGAASVINGTKVTSFFNLNCDVAGTLTSTTDAETVLGSLSVNTGTLALLTRTITTTAGATIVNGATVTFTTGGLTVGTNLICNGTLGTAGTSAGNINVTGTSTIGNSGLITMATTTYTATGDLTSNGTITFSGAGNLKLAGNYTQNGTYTMPNTSTVTFNGSGSQTIGGSSFINFNKLTINGTGTVTLADSITVGSILTLTTGVLDVSANDYGITCEGNFTNNDATVGAFVARSGRVWMVGTQTMPGTKATTFNDVEIKSGTITLNLALTVSDTLNLLGGTLTTGADAVNIGSALLNNSGATFTAGGGVVTFTGNTVQPCNIGGANAITIPSLTTNLTNPTDTLYLNNGGLTVGTAFKISQGVFHCKTNSVIGDNLTLTFTMLAGTTFILGLPTSSAVVSFPQTKTYAFNATSTVIYQANAAQTIATPAAATPYGNLYIYSGAGGPFTNTLAGAGNFDVAGNLIIGNGTSLGTILQVSTNVITLTGALPAAGSVTINTDGELQFTGAGGLSLTGNFANNSTLATGFSASTSTTTFKGSSNEILGGTHSTTFYNLTVSMAAAADILTLGDSTTVLNTFGITRGVFDQSAAGNYSLVVEAAFNNTATATAISPENATTYLGVGTGNVTFAGSTQTNVFYNLICNPGGANTVSATGSNTTVNNNLTVNSGTLSFTTKTITVIGVVTNNATISLSTGTLSVADSLLNNTGENINITGTGKILATGDIDNLGPITYTGNGTFNAVNLYNSSTITAIGSVSTITNVYNNGTISFTSGTLNVVDSVTNYNGQTISITTGKLLGLGDIYNTGTISFGGVGPFTGVNLFVNGPSGLVTGGTVVATMSGNTTIANGGSMTLSTGTLNTAGNLLINGTLTYTGAGNLKVGGNYTDNGTYTYATNTTTFTGGAGAIQLIGGTGGPGGSPLPLQFYNVTVNGNATDVVTLADSMLVNNLFLLTAGSFDQSTSNYSLTCLKGFTNMSSLTKGINAAVCFYKSFLRKVFCIFGIGYYTQTKIKNTFAKSIYQMPEGIFVFVF